MKPSVLVRLDNLRSGGGLQVGHSFLTELASLAREPEISRSYPWITDSLRVDASWEVIKSCGGAIADAPFSVSVRKPGFVAILGIRRAQVVFTLFGPTYDFLLARRRLSGFADGTSLFPEEAGTTGHWSRATAKQKLRRWLSKRFFRSADVVVVEANHVRDGLAARWGIDPSVIHVVPNVLNQVFSQYRHQGLRKNKKTTLDYCYVTRAYPHKNLEILGGIADALAREHGLSVRFLLTLTDQEWDQLSPSVKQVSRNLGPVAVTDLPAIYGRSDGCVFPSRLESFSVTPLEALATGTPLVASDRFFCRDLLGGTALYADPDDPSAWASAIASIVLDRDLTEERIERGRELISALPTARDRALAYLDLIDRELSLTPASAAIEGSA